MAKARITATDEHVLSLRIDIRRGKGVLIHPVGYVDDKQHDGDDDETHTSTKDRNDEHSTPLSLFYL